MLEKLRCWYLNFTFWHENNGFVLAPIAWFSIALLVTITLGWKNGLWMSFIIGLLYFLMMPFFMVTTVSIVVGLVGVVIAVLGQHFGWWGFLGAVVVLLIALNLVLFVVAEVLKFTRRKRDLRATSG